MHIRYTIPTIDKLLPTGVKGGWWYVKHKRRGEEDTHVRGLYEMYKGRAAGDGTGHTLEHEAGTQAKNGWQEGQIWRPESCEGC